jgi:hypothetical protein
MAVLCLDAKILVVMAKPGAILIECVEAEFILFAAE